MIVISILNILLFTIMLTVCVCVCIAYVDIFLYILRSLTLSHFLAVFSVA